MNVDVLETVCLAQKLRDRAVNVRTVLLPREAHEFVRQSGYARLWHEMITFFGETLPIRQAIRARWCRTIRRRAF